MRKEISLPLTETALHPHPRDLVGLFFEDINFAADGGLYAEMLENRSFEAADAYGCVGSFYTVPDPGYAWDPVGGARLRFVTGSPLSQANPHYLRLLTDGPGQGVSNRAYDGVCLKRGMTYHVSFYARTVTQGDYHVTVSVEKDGAVFARAVLPLCRSHPARPFSDLPESDRSAPDYPAFIENMKRYDPGFTDDPPDPEAAPVCGWIRYETELTASEDARFARFVLTVDGPGVFEFDLISMMPGDAVAGIFRKDLFDALDALKPGFIRFPGGCIVEGVNLENRYQWKRTVGPVKDRKVIPCLWGFDENRANGTESHREKDSHYSQSYGLGFYEFFLLCELLGAKPLPVVGVGLACQFRSQEQIEVDSPQFDALIRDTLDLMEFANGAPDTVWGGLRAAMGHPEPFRMDMIGVGNEQWETSSARFRERAARFEAAIHAADPDMRIIGTAGPVMHAPMWRTLRDFYRRENAKGKRTYAVDEHFYQAPAWFRQQTRLYDDYPRDVFVFAGEYAAQSPTKENSVEGALAEAAFLTGVERNSDVVRLASYAPLFNRIGHSQWQPDLIWFDDAHTVLTPSYYVQQLFSRYAGDVVLETPAVEGQPLGQAGDGVFISLTGSFDARTGAICEWVLKLVNTGDSPVLLRLIPPEGIRLPGVCRLLELSGDGQAADPSRALPENARLSDGTAPTDRLSVPAKAMQVLILSL